MTRLPFILAVLLAAPLVHAQRAETVTLSAEAITIRADGPETPVALSAETVEFEAPHQTDTESIDALVAAMYDVLSGPSDQPRDWDRFRSLFAEGGRMVPMTPDASGGWRPDIRSLDHYIEGFDQILAEHPAFQGKGFYESEAARRVEEYGTIAVVWSTYEGRFSESDERPFMRGVNTLDLVRVGDEWRVLQVLWQQETPQMPLPDEYLETPEDD